MNGLNDGGVIACAGQIHGFFEGFTDSRWQAIDGSANFDLHLIQLAANVLVGFKFLAPLGAKGFHIAFILSVDLADLSRIEVYQLLGLILRRAQVLGTRGCRFDGGCIESMSFGDRKIGVGVWGRGFGFWLFAAGSLVGSC